jgi:hypothetical protein
VWPEQCRVLSVATGSPLTSALRLLVGPNEALLIVKGSQPMPLASLAKVCRNSLVTVYA